MRKSKLSKYKQELLLELFVALPQIGLVSTGTL